MIIIKNNGGRMGNQLHLFIHGMYIHEKTNMKFFPERINFFKNTYNIKNGEVKEKIINCSEIRSKCKNIQEYYENIKRNENGLCVDFMFDKYEYFSTIGKEKIKKYLEIENENVFKKPKQEDLVVHIRLGDYCHINCVTDKKLYIDYIKKIKYDNCYIVTDEPNNNYLNDFKNIGCIIRNNSEIEDFIFLKNAKKIIISKSTYSWTAAYISDANEIYFPLSDNKWPYFSDPKNGTDLRPLDLTNWKYI